MHCQRPLSTQGPQLQWLVPTPQLQAAAATAAVAALRWLRPTHPYQLGRLPLVLLLWAQKLLLALLMARLLEPVYLPLPPLLVLPPLQPLVLLVVVLLQMCWAPTPAQWRLLWAPLHHSRPRKRAAAAKSAPGRPQASVAAPADQRSVSFSFSRFLQQLNKLLYVSERGYCMWVKQVSNRHYVSTASMQQSIAIPRAKRPSQQLCETRSTWAKAVLAPAMLPAAAPAENTSAAVCQAAAAGRPWAAVSPTTAHSTASSAGCRFARSTRYASLDYCCQGVYHKPHLSYQLGMPWHI